jgi:hypothetical protein
MKSHILHCKDFQIGKCILFIEYGYDTELILSPVIAITQSARNRKFGIMMGLLIFNLAFTIEVT